MSGAIFRAMLLGLLRDRGALLMSFVLPAIFFLIMAEVFSSATSGLLNLKVAVLDEVGSETSSRLVAALSEVESLRMQTLAAGQGRERGLRGARVGVAARDACESSMISITPELITGRWFRQDFNLPASLRSKLTTAHQLSPVTEEGQIF